MRREYSEFHSGFGEDHFLVNHFERHLPDQGLFVDVGAGDPFHASNTLHFERNGWDGLLIEADPRRIERLRQFRRGEVLPLAIGPIEGSAELFLTGHLDHASLVNLQNASTSVEVQVRRLESVLRERRIERIDLLSIDTEGTELDVWRSYSRELVPTSFVIIEFETCGILEKKSQTFDMLRQDGYEVVLETPSNLVAAFRGQL